MRDYIELGPSPAAEDCVQVGTENYRELSRIECKRYIAQLRKQFGDEPPFAKLTIKYFPHDFGEYADVVCYFEDTDQEAQEYAFKCEGEAWDRWMDAKAHNDLDMPKEAEILE